MMRPPLALLALVLLAGCVEPPAPGEQIDRLLQNRRIQSRRAAVSVPTAIGTGLGLAIGFPIAILAAPVTIPFGLVACRDDSQSRVDVLLSSFFWPEATLGTGGGYAFGGIPSALYGDDDGPPPSKH